MSKSIRIRTTPGEDKNIQIKVNQDFDFLEILSLKISQQDLYTTFCADYGVVVGRVIANNGFGVPNAKVSVFVPITDEDEKNQLIKDLYPYKTVASKRGNIRYNLLLSKSTCTLNKAVGTFPTKEEVLNNDIMIEIFDKYYKYTTRTNDAGDYMIFGAPTGQQTIHMDVDLSDAGVFSVRPYNFIDDGFSEKLFDSRTEFKQSDNLDSLPQIKSGDKGIDIIPFWGDEEQCQIGITRADFDTNFNFEPRAIFIGSVFTDQGKNSVKETCGPDNQVGNQCEMRTGPGFLEVIRVSEYTYNSTQDRIVPTALEEYNLPQGNDAIDEDGVWVVSLPMNLDHVITDEFGNLVPSLDPEVGVPTKSMARFKIKYSEQSTHEKRRTATLITPSLNRETGGLSNDAVPNAYTAADTTPTSEKARWTTDITQWWGTPGFGNGQLTTRGVQDDPVNGIPGSQRNHTFDHDFHEFQWNQIYTISQYIPKYKKGSGLWGDRFGFIGLKGVDECGENQVMPFNSAVKKFSILFELISLFLKLQAALIKLLIILANFCLCLRLRIRVRAFGKTIISFCLKIKICPFSFLQGLFGGSITLNCESMSIGPQTISFTCSNYNVCTDCNDMGNIGLSFTSHTPSCNDDNHCEEMCKVDDWLCCAILDLAIDRKVIRYTFTDAWLTGAAYLFQFRYKEKSNGQENFCGPGSNKHRSWEYQRQICCNERGAYNPPDWSGSIPTTFNQESMTCKNCIVRGPKSTQQGNSLYHENNQITGAKDIDDLIYCPEYMPTKIVNIGRTDACEDVVTKIERCITSQECLLDLFQNPGCPSGFGCFTGTYYEEGYDTEQWTRSLPNTSYQNPSDIVGFWLGVYNCNFNDLFKGGGGHCWEHELENQVWKDVHEVSKVYTNIILADDGKWDNSNTITNAEGETVGFEALLGEAEKFHPTGLPDGDVRLGDGAGWLPNGDRHFRNSPYFYFGLYNGKTAMDRLRKEYLVT